MDTYEQRKADEQAARQKEVDDKAAAVKKKRVTLIKRIGLGFIAATILFTFLGSFYTVDTGQVAIVKRFGKAVRMETDGLHLKAPWVEDTVTMEIRTRKYQQVMIVSTTGKIEDKNGKTKVELQMPSAVKISANWNIPKEYALEIYIKYGGLTQFEDRVLDPRVLKVTKASFPKYSIEEIVSNRQGVTDMITNALITSLEGTNVKMSNINIEDIEFPDAIATAIKKKQVAKEEAKTEQAVLDKQKLMSQQAVNTATAKAGSINVVAEAEAKAIRLKGKAEADVIKEKANALKKGGRFIIQYTKAQNWNGVLPVVAGGSGALPFMDVGKIAGLVNN